MGFYSQVIFPCLCDVLLRQKFLANYRRELLASVNGDILEIGFGTGLNLPHYPHWVRKITAVDSNAGMNWRAAKRIRQSRIEVDHRTLDCERLPFPDHTFDCVVSTWTLCSIDDVGQALSGISRVLKAGGQFLFLEHGLSSESGIQKWQRRLNRLEMRWAGGCRLDRNMKDIVAVQPFASVQVETFYLKKFPKTHTFMYQGVATK